MDSMENFFKKQPNVRGMLTFWIIFLLRKKSMNGYEIMKEIESSTAYWKPTTGAIYPALYKLKRMGLIKIEEMGERKQKIYSLTDSGKLVVRQITENMIKRFRDSKFRRVTDSLIWTDEPDELRGYFDKLFISIFDFRSSLKGKYKNLTHMKKTKAKLNKVIKELKI